MKSASHLLKSWADRVWDRLWREMNVGEGFTKARPSVGQIVRVEGILFSWRCEEWWNAAQKRGRNCNNSCRLLRNTECFPAIWVNKHSLDPWGPTQLLSKWTRWPVSSAALSNQTCFQLTVMKEEITASLKFLALGTAALVPNLLFCICSHAIWVFVRTQINRVKLFLLF